MFFRLLHKCLLRKRKASFLVICCFSLFYFESLNAQTVSKTYPLYKVVHLPRKTLYSKDKLNKEVAKARDKETVRKIIRQKNFSSAQLIIQIQQGKNKYVWWTINTTTGYEREDNDIILQSKTSLEDRKDGGFVRPGLTNVEYEVHKLSDFVKLFRDTLVLLDTLKASLLFNDNNKAGDEYYIEYKCQENKVIKKQIPVTNRKLLLSALLIEPCFGEVVPISLYNNQNSPRMAASCSLVFLTAEQKETLLTMATFFKKSNPQKDLHAIAMFITAYVSPEFGTLYYPQLINWLKSNLK